MKAPDRILETLLEMDDHQGVFFNLKTSLEIAHPDLSPDEIADTLDQFRKMKLISTQAYQINGSTRFIRVNPSAYIYFENREKRDAQEALQSDTIEKIEGRPWNYKLIFSTYMAGLVSGIILTGIFLMLIKDAILP